MDKLIDKNFPINALVPKNETGALNFVTKYPDFNGKGCTIAIFDSGVDGKASGLKNIPGGDIKLIERFDCSGAGDTDMKKVVQVRGDGTILGLSGRSLKISKYMKERNESGEYRIGLKSLDDVYHSKVRERSSNDRKLKKWDEHQKKAQIAVSRAQEEFDAKNASTNPLPLKEKLAKENLDFYSEILSSYEKKYSDIKITYDCILFESDGVWVAVIDTTETGDLENAIMIKEFSKTHDVAKIDDFFSISINVHDNGNVLELVGMCSSHGTHVASIASGYHPEDPNLNGVAPGAQIVSITIGDGRLGSMETGKAMVRGIIKIMELCDRGTKIDVINMSYGEHAHWSNSGRIGELMSELINRYGVVWVLSAGNHGPALSTIGTPPDIAQPSLIGVGAYVSPEMMEAEYALRHKLPPNVYTWTSRDPCMDGGFGVTICAPGAAIASVPECTLSKAQLMNGTSMAAPHVAGAVALLISGLKKKGISYTPYSIKSALWNTATNIDYIDKFAQGNGLLNVEKAFENLVEYANRQENEIMFKLSCGTNWAKGIHIRQGPLVKEQDVAVTVEPIMINEKLAPAQNKLAFNLRLTLVPTAPWVQCGKFLDLCYSSRAFNVKIDPTGLAPGVHSARIKAYDSTCVEKGTIFEVPITVVQPIVVEERSLYEYSSASIHFKPNTINRDFFHVPKNATWAVLELISDNPQDFIGGRYCIHTQQILPSKYCKAMETQRILTVNGENYTTHTFKVVEENILELCIAKYWSNFGDHSLRYKIRFYGVRANNTEIVMHSGQGIHRIDLTSLSPVEINPAVSLKTAVMVLKPTESKISALTSRDVIPPERQIFQNILSYTFHLTKTQDVSLYAPLLYNVLYESVFEAQMWMVFDANKQMVFSGDAYSKDTYTKLEKGEYTVKLQVRHEKQDFLEKISDATMLLNFKLSNCFSLDLYKSFNQAIINGKKLSAFLCLNGSHRPLYINPISNDKLNKAYLPAQISWLEGSIYYAREEAARKIDSFPFQYILTEGPNGKKNGNNTATTNTKSDKSKMEEYKESLRDFQISQIAKLDATGAEELYNELYEQHSTHSPLHLALMQFLDSNETKNHLPFTFKQNLLKQSETEIENLKEKLLKIVELATKVIENTDQDGLLKFYGMKVDNRPDAAKIKTNMDKQKQVLTEAFVRKMSALSKLQIIEEREKQEASSENFMKEVDNLYIEMGKFVSYTDEKVQQFIIWHAFNYKHYGRLIKQLTKLYEDKLQREVMEEAQLVARQIQGWSHIDQIMGRMMVTANPQSFRLF